MDGRELRRTRSESAVPEPQRTRVRVHHRPTPSVSRVASPRSPLDFPYELGPPPLAVVPEAPPRTIREALEEARGEPAPQEPENTDVPDGLAGMIMVWLGYAGPNAKARRELLYLIFYTIFALAQFVIIITLSAFAAHVESPMKPGETEWRACERPLGAWNVLWLIRVALGSLLAFWTWWREHTIRQMQAARRQAAIDAEMAYVRPRPHIRGEWLFNVTPARLHANLTSCTVFFSLIWFVVAHILAYTSVNTCRRTSPHVWYLTFGILCILYVMVLEIFLLGLLVFILGPVIYLAYNIVLLCFGRHPVQNPHVIKPDVVKLPASIVQQIPLVLYIPPPPGESTDGITPVAIPPPTHAYPPESGPSNLKASTPAPTQPTLTPPPKRRFAFFRRKRTPKKKTSPSSPKKVDADPSVDNIDDVDDDADVPWDDMWERSEYPFVRLEGNRAVCAICLMDFEAPRRVRGKRSPEGNPSPPEGAQPGAGAGGVAQRQTETQEVQVEDVTEEERDALHLNDAGEGAQPLRLLPCGHAFHQTCVDPWLTDVSGRCPTCQRPVELPAQSKKAKRSRRRQRTEP